MRGGLIWGCIWSPEVMLTGPLAVRVSCPWLPGLPLWGAEDPEYYIALPARLPPERSFGFLSRARRLQCPAKATGQELASRADNTEAFQLPLCWEF